MFQINHEAFITKINHRKHVKHSNIHKQIEGEQWADPSNIHKQIEGCRIGGPLSAIFSSIYMTKSEVVKPTNPRF